MSRETWGNYLDRRIDELREIQVAFAERGCVISLHDAAMYRELAFIHTSVVNIAHEEDESDTWKNGDDE